jgi:hypothetical protein
MRFQVGDKVKFLNDSGGGTIAEIVDRKLVKVRIEDGFDIPVLATDLIMDESVNTNHPGLLQDVSKPVQVRKAGKVAGDDIESMLPENLPDDTVKNVSLGFIPVDTGNAGMSDIDVFLINDDDYAVCYLIGFRENLSWHFLKTGYLEPNTKLNIETFSQSQISKIKAMHIQLLFIAMGKYQLQPPAESFIALDGVRFYKENTYKENSYFHEKAFIIKISDDSDNGLDHLSGEEITKAMKEKEPAEKKKQAVPSAVNEIIEVDLHIHELVDDYSRLSPGEILELQMKRFFAELENGLTSETGRLVFIHGVGNGKLKYEMIKALNEKYPDLTYQDASFKKYGYGATLVSLK